MEVYFLIPVDNKNRKFSSWTQSTCFGNVMRSSFILFLKEVGLILMAPMWNVDVLRRLYAAVKMVFNRLL